MKARDYAERFAWKYIARETHYQGRTSGEFPLVPSILSNGKLKCETILPDTKVQS